MIAKQKRRGAFGAKELLITIVGGVIVVLIAHWLFEGASLKQAGPLVRQGFQTLIPLTKASASTPTVMVSRLWVRVNKYEVKAGAMIPEEKPVRVNSDDMKPGQWYSIKMDPFQVDDKISYLPVQLYHSYFEHANIDIALSYSASNEDGEHTLSISNVNVPLTPK